MKYDYQVIFGFCLAIKDCEKRSDRKKKLTHYLMNYVNNTKWLHKLNKTVQGQCATTCPIQPTLNVPKYAVFKMFLWKLRHSKYSSDNSQKTTWITVRDDNMVNLFTNSEKALNNYVPQTEIYLNAP